MRNRYVLLCDIVLFIAAAVAAFVLRFDLRFMHTRPEFLAFLAASLLVKCPMFYAFGLYHRYWAYANAADVARVAATSTAATVALGLLLVAAVNLGHVEFFSRAVLAIDWLLTILAAGGIRLAIRLEQDSRARIKSELTVPRRRMIIVGAGNVGTMVARLVEQAPGSPIRIVGFVDDDPGKQNKRVYGHRVLGSRADLARLVATEGVDEVLIAIPTAPQDVVDAICAECDRIGVLKRVIPSIPNLLHGTLSIDDLRVWRSVAPVLMSRTEPVRPDLSFGQVLVTGGAGFIGANFVRYWLNAHPTSRVIVLDKLTYAGNPANLAGIEEQYGDRYVFVRGDICDKACVSRTLDDFAIDAVVNFAAESHVDRSLHLPQVFLQLSQYRYGLPLYPVLRQNCLP